MTAAQASRTKSIPWSNLTWALPLGYVVVEPYRSGAPWTELVVAALALAFVLAMFLVITTDISRRPAVCSATAAIFLMAVAFLPLSPSAGLFFAMTASLAPLAVGGNLMASALLVTGTVIAYILECWLLKEPVTDSLFCLAVIAEAALVGVGMTFFAKQQIRTKRLHQTMERERIASDLHDVLGQTLSSIALKSELARRVFDADPVRALAEINDIERISRQALHDVRAAIHGYHSGDIQTELNRVTSMLEAARISVTCERTDVDTSAAQERVIALVLREAATNVVRHSQATQCRITLGQSESECRIEVSDNGIGGSFTDGLGMRSIRARIEALAGLAEWNTDRGTCLTISIPLTEGRS